MQAGDSIPSVLRILHVEDDSNDSELVRHQFLKEHLPAEITRVERQADFVEALKTRPLDLVLADCNLPLFDGFAALEILQRERPQLPFIFVSGSLGEELAVESMKRGATDYVLKSQLARLGSSVRRALREVRQREEQQQADEKVRRGQQELEDFFDHSPVGMHWAGPDGRILKVNQAELEMLGYTLEEYLGHPVEEFHVNQAAIRDVLRRLARGETAHNFESLMRCKNGALKNVLIEANVLWEQGRFIHTRSFTRDITERKQAQEALARLGAIVESSSDAIIGKTLDGVITSWNSGAEKVFGYAAADAKGRSIMMLIPPEQSAEELRILDQIRRGDRVEPFETVRVRKDGRHIHVAVTISPVRDSMGLVIGASKIARDITERKRAEEALRASENRYRLLFESNPIPAFVHDHAALAILAVNEAAIHHYGYPREQFLSLTLNDLAVPEEISAFLERLSHLGQEGGLAGIWSHRKKDGRFSQMEITSHPVVFDGKRAWLSLAMNVTERLNLEAQLRQSQKMESVGQLAGGIAHDFNNLLTVINGHAALLLAEEQLNPGIAEPLREITEAARRAGELTRQLLTFSRKQAMQPQVVDLNEVVNNVSKMLRRILGEDIALELTFSPGLPCVKADLGMIEQVLLNLAVNSRDAMPKGGRLQLGASLALIDPAYPQQNPEAFAGRAVCLTFTDDGCGISPENLPRIFEPFFTTKGIERGTGLGLATVYGIVRQHKGWIEVASQLQKGTTFKIFLPACDEKASAPAGSVVEQRVIGGTETILVVEDEVPLLKLMRHILESYGYQVLEASTGALALEVWREHGEEIDLVVTDLVLPDGMAGRELAQALQASRSSLKIIYTSGYDTENMVQDAAVGAGPNFIQKPFHARKLAEVVYDCLNEK